MGAGQQQAPKQPPLNPIDIPAVLAQALSFDVQGYDASQADYSQRFPGLVQQRNQAETDAYGQLTGPLDPAVQSDFAKQGLIKSLTAFGAGNQSAGVGPTGTASGNTMGASIANSVLAKQDYDRTNLSNLLGLTPEQTFGLSGADIAKLSIANNGVLNSNNTIGYNNQVLAANAQVQSDLQTGQLISGIGGALGGLGSLYVPRANTSYVDYATVG